MNKILTNKIRINEAIVELWKEQFFETYQSPINIEKKLRDKYGMNPSNVTMNLKLCKHIIRKEDKGWIQRIRYSEKSSFQKQTVSKDLELCDITNDKMLIKACESNYKSGNYWDTVFNALRHMEVRVRNKSGLSAADVGADLMEKAFKPNVGILKIPTCATAGEEDGFKLITKGMMIFHRNAKGHREELIDKNLALKIISYVDYLLQVVDTAQKR
jgi:uncharacterized protein (TIGR02391 family)